MRKQLARVGAIAVAAMMVGTTAFAAEAELTVKYVEKNKVAVSVSAATENDQVTILSVTDGTQLASVTGENIAYINQEKATATGGVIETAPAAGQTFTFDTAGPTTAKKFNVYGAGDGNTINTAAAIVWKTAPVESMAFGDVSAIELAAGTEDAAIKEKLKDVEVTLTHDSDDNATTVIKGNDAMLSYSAVTAEGKTTATLDPANMTGGQEFTTTTTVTAEVQLQVEEEPEEPIASAVELVPSSLNLTVQKGTEKADITPKFLLDSGWTLKAHYTMTQGTLEDYVMTASDFTATVTNDASPYNVTIHSTKTDFANSVPAPADITITVTVSETDSATITGTVKTKPNLTLDVTLPAVGAVVAVYDSTGTTLQDVVLTQAGGAFTATVPSEGNYKLVVSYLAVTDNGTNVTGVVNNGAAVKTVNVAGATAETGDIVLVVPNGDANGDGTVNTLDTQMVNEGFGNTYFGAAE